MDGENFEIAEWMERILPMVEAAHLAEYEEGHFPPMALYHSNDNHFDLLVADTNRLVTSGLLGRVEDVQQDKGEWHTVAGRSTKKSNANSSGEGLQGSNQTQKRTQDEFPCDECEASLESKGLLDAHKYSHEEKRSKAKFICDDCDMTCSSEEDLMDHMKKEHDDGTWTCDDCHFQTNKSESLRQHLKKTGHQPSVASQRHTNEIRQCYTCKEDFEGYKAMMNHRFENHPSNKPCKNIPICTGWVNGNPCWYVHPKELSGQTNVNIENISPTVQQEIECRRCATKFNSRNQFMNHYTTKHTGNIVCRDWLKNSCKRVKCWYRHSNLPHTEGHPSPCRAVQGLFP